MVSGLEKQITSLKQQFVSSKRGEAIITRGLIHEAHRTVSGASFTFDQMLPIHSATAEQRCRAFIKTMESNPNQNQ